MRSKSGGEIEGGRFGFVGREREKLSSPGNPNNANATKPSRSFRTCRKGPACLLELFSDRVVVSPCPFVT